MSTLEKTKPSKSPKSKTSSSPSASSVAPSTTSALTPSTTPTTGASPADAPATSLTDRLAALDAAVEWFYSDDFDLDQALARYKSAAALAESIEQDLASLKNTVSLLDDFSK